MKKKANAILAADIHIRHDVPTCRMDDYTMAMWDKWEEILELAHVNQCPVLVAGDLGHRPRWPDKLIRDFIQVSKKYKGVQIIVVPGQHDLPSHSLQNWEESSLGILEADETIIYLDGDVFTESDFIIYSFPWGTEIKQDKFVKPSKSYIAISHQLVMQGKDNQVDFPNAKFKFADELLKENLQYDLILTGDNHKSFVVGYEGRLLVNPGSMMRSTADQEDHKPSVYLWYSSTNTVKRHYLGCEQGVISRKHIQDKKEKEQRMQAFIESIHGGQEIALSFEDNVQAELDALDGVCDIVEKRVWECIDE